MKFLGEKFQKTCQTCQLMSITPNAAESFKFGDGDGPNLWRVKKVDVSSQSTFIENIFRSGLTLFSSNDLITIKIDIKKCLLPKQNKQASKKMGHQRGKRETN